MTSFESHPSAFLSAGLSSTFYQGFNSHAQGSASAPIFGMILLSGARGLLVFCQPDFKVASVCSIAQPEIFLPPSPEDFRDAAVVVEELFIVRPKVASLGLVGELLFEIKPLSAFTQEREPPHHPLRVASLEVRHHYVRMEGHSAGEMAVLLFSCSEWWDTMHHKVIKTFLELPPTLQMFRILHFVDPAHVSKLMWRLPSNLSVEQGIQWAEELHRELNMHCPEASYAEFTLDWGGPICRRFDDYNSLPLQRFVLRAFQTLFQFLEPQRSQVSWDSDTNDDSELSSSSKGSEEPMDANNDSDSPPHPCPMLSAKAMPLPGSLVPRVRFSKLSMVKVSIPSLSVHYVREILMHCLRFPLVDNIDLGFLVMPDLWQLLSDLADNWTTAERIEQIPEFSSRRMSLVLRILAPAHLQNLHSPTRLENAQDPSLPGVLAIEDEDTLCYLANTRHFIAYMPFSRFFSRHMQIYYPRHPAILERYVAAGDCPLGVQGDVHPIPQVIVYDRSPREWNASSCRENDQYAYMEIHASRDPSAEVAHWALQEATEIQSERESLPDSAGDLTDDQVLSRPGVLDWVVAAIDNFHYRLACAAMHQFNSS